MQRRGWCCQCAGPRQDDNVDGWQMTLVCAKTFAHTAFDAVARRRQGNAFFCDRQTEPWMALRRNTMTNNGGEQFDAAPTPTLKNPLEFFRLEQPGAPGKARHGRIRRFKDFGKLLRDQALTALRATARQDLTTANGGHARTETVSALAADVAGLESTLGHDDTAQEKQKRARSLAVADYCSKRCPVDKYFGTG